jgi:hypothetical protein
MLKINHMTTLKNVHLCFLKIGVDMNRHELPTLVRYIWPAVEPEWNARAKAGNVCIAAGLSGLQELWLGMYVHL